MGRRKGEPINDMEGANGCYCLEYTESTQDFLLLPNFISLITIKAKYLNNFLRPMALKETVAQT